MVAPGVESHVGDGSCLEVGSPIQKFWKNVRTKRTMRTKSMGGGLRRSCGVRCCGLGKGEGAAWGFRPRRKTGQSLLATMLEGAEYGLLTLYRSGLGAFSVRHAGHICGGVGVVSSQGCGRAQPSAARTEFITWPKGRTLQRESRVECYVVTPEALSPVPAEPCGPG